MSRRKLPAAKDWRNRNLSDWNTTTFTEYLRDKHREQFGIEYVPMRNWKFEQGQIGRLIGTRAKKGTHSKTVVKRFIDEAFAEYEPTKEWPGTNFGFIYSFRRHILQRAEAEELAREQREQAVDEAPSMTELESWF